MIDADCPLLNFFSEVMVFDVRCFVLGLIFGIFAISIAPSLSSKTLQWILGGLVSTGMPWSCASCSNHMIGSTSLID